MAFRATNIVPQEAYQTVKRAAIQLRVNAQAHVTQLAASGADYDFLRDIYLTQKRADAQFAALKTTPGLAQYARDQEDDPAYDVAAEFNAMQAAIANVIAWMDANVPTNVTAEPTTAWVSTTESLIATTFTPAQTAGLRTQLQGVVDSIS